LVLSKEGVPMIVVVCHGKRGLYMVKIFF